MKYFGTKITVFTFVVSLSFAAIWLTKIKPELNVSQIDETELNVNPVDVSDPNIYPVKFCDLMKESKTYDGKIVEIQTSYQQGYEASFLTDSDCGEITASCFLGEEACDNIFDSLIIAAKSNRGKVTVTGKFNGSKYDPDNGYLPQIEILTVKDIDIPNSSK